MRILQISPQFPFPPDDGGRIGIANIIKEFSNQGAEVTLFTFGDIRSIPEKELAKSRKFIKNLIFCSKSTSNSISNIITALIRNKPVFTDKHFNMKVKIDLLNVLEKQSFDVIHADHSSMAPAAVYAGSLIKKPVGLRLHNIEYKIWERYADNLPKSSLKGIYIRHQSKLLKRAEIDLYSKCDVCFAITDKDAQLAKSISPNANIVLAGPGVNPEEWSPKDGMNRNPHEMILATTYKWIHNVNGLKWFLDQVHPIVRNVIPDASLTLLGKNPPDWLKEYKDMGVNVLGYVPEVQPYFNRAGIFITPLFVGAGIRIKILEAMAMELPVVATSIAAEGIQANENQGIFISNKPEEFALNIIRLMKNTDLAYQAGKSAASFVTSNFSWKKSVGIMLNEYRKFL